MGLYIGYLLKYHCKDFKKEFYTIQLSRPEAYTSGRVVFYRL